MAKPMVASQAIIDRILSDVQQNLLSVWPEVLLITASFFILEAIIVPGIRLKDPDRLRRVPTSMTMSFLRYLLGPFATLAVPPLAPIQNAVGTRLQWLWGLMEHAGFVGHWMSLLLGMLLVELVVYVTHRLSHEVPFLWRIHRVHHMETRVSSLAVDIAHPLVILIPLVWSGLGMLRMIGVTSGSIVAWQTVNAYNPYFQHSQIRFPKRVEKILELLFILPRHHILHHSREMRQTNSNYGFFFNVWDRLFGTYCSDEIGPGFQTGLDEFSAPESRTAWAMLWSPLRDVPTAAPSVPRARPDVERAPSRRAG